MSAAALDASVAISLQEGTRVLTALQKDFGPEQVENIMDEACDAISIHREINDLLRQELGDSSLHMATDEDLLGELTATMEGGDEKESPEAVAKT
eukprot:CAMPEP_0176454386 /NCGR_PEP_ID=MMETSP0127-20121128/29931_1 /TAXON_ID=938130 /ORGANISM="Platyophrya macrostoma, Strain WH" /LENGTH=94 /DNA_ID=CAMNT_0017843683 /DNA_START=101 /DNA_END=381 /DNA_ORIENTATION=-